MLMAPESVGRRCAQLRGPGADLAPGPRLVHGALAFWMQTTGADDGWGDFGSLPMVSAAVRASGCVFLLLYFLLYEVDA
jgi:hypothetical protein